MLKQFPLFALLFFLNVFFQTVLNGVGTTATEENCPPVEVRVWINVRVGTILWGNCPRTVLNISKVLVVNVNILCFKGLKPFCLSSEQGLKTETLRHMKSGW